MSKIKAEIIADSKNEFGNRITTMVVTFPRFILAELNTHRVFSRNSASSRAIPFEKMVKSVQENPFIPIAWQKDHKGMQGTEYLDKSGSQDCINDWLAGRDEAIKRAKIIASRGTTKQIINRVLEAYMWHTVIITSTEWENFFALRCPQYRIESDIVHYLRSKKDCIKENKNCVNMTEMDWLKANTGQAEIHMMALAEAMWDAMNESTPKELKVGEWHIPFGDDIDCEYLEYYSRCAVGIDNINKVKTEAKVKVATARCARVSYTVVGEDKIPDVKKDIELHDKFLQQKPFHASPFEHCARAMDIGDDEGFIGWSRNFRGFVQYREIIEKL